MWRSGILTILLLGACDAGTSGNVDANGNGSSDARMIDAAGGVGEPPELAGITLLHNQVRAAVTTSTPLPALQWDPALAAYAATWAAMCVDTAAPTGLIDHDPNRTNVAGYAYIGENIYGSSATATPAATVNSWAAEQANFTYPNTCAGGQVCGHYTQIVWRDTTHLGCALHDCPGLAYHSSVVCDYGPGGNIGTQAPY